MEVGHWITLAIFVAGNLFTVAGVIISNRIDTTALKTQMKIFADDMMGMQKELKQFGNILVTLADFKGEMNRIQDRATAQGQRLDENIRVTNERMLRLERRLDPNSGGG